MIRRAALIAALFLGSLRAQEEHATQLDVRYVVDATKPEEGSVRVKMQISNVRGEFLDVALPCWHPGAYRLQNDHRTVKGVGARAGEMLPVKPLDEMTWRVKTDRASNIIVEYVLEVPKDRLDKDHYFFEGPSLYMYVVGHKDAPCRVEFKLPEGWKVGTGLESKDGVYSARDYDTFIDCPTELGRFELFEFEQDKAKYQLVVHANGKVDGEKMIEVLRKIVKDQNAMFGGPPFERFVFLYHFRGGVGGGGLEHLNSTNISLPYAAVSRDPASIASISSHEYFHLWNVKRIRPHELGPFDYTGMVRSRHLWLCEGVTSYYGDRTMARAGLWTEDQYFRHLGLEVETLQNNPDRKYTSVERASEVVWDRQDWPRVDYYNKGELLGLLLDLRIRTLTEGKKSFDDVMRYLYETYVVKPAKEGKGPIGVGFEQNGILKAVNFVSGSDFNDFYKKHVSGLEELPYEEILSAAGLEVSLKVIKGVPELPLSLRGSSIASVIDGSEAAKAGLKPGDRITAINGKEITRQTFNEEVRKLEVGKEAKLTLVRGETTLEVSIKVRAHERTQCSIKRKADATELQKKILDGWLGR